MIYTKSKVSPKGKVNGDDLRRVSRNAIIFSAPALAVFFTQLGNGVELKDAGLVALLVAYGLLADFFRKLNDGKK